MFSIADRVRILEAVVWFEQHGGRVLLTIERLRDAPTAPQALPAPKKRGRPFKKKVPTVNEPISADADQ